MRLVLPVLLAACAARRTPPPARATWRSGPPEMLVEFENDMSSLFRIARVLFVLDGQPIYQRVCEERDDACRERLDAEQVFFGTTAVGVHTLSLALTYQSEPRRWGIFSYIRAYTFRIRSSRSFTVAPGRRVRLRVVAYERGGVTAPLEERPAVRYEETSFAVGAAPVPPRRAMGDRAVGPPG